MHKSIEQCRNAKSNIGFDRTWLAARCDYLQTTDLNLYGAASCVVIYYSIKWE